MAKSLVTMSYGMEQTRLQPAIRGKIADTLDCPVASARVVISGSKLSEKLCAMTGNEGYFMFNRVPPGIYTLEVNCSGFSKLVQRGIAVQEHAITGLDMKMNFQEDSRSLTLQSIRLNYVNEVPGTGMAEEPSRLVQQLDEIIATLRLDEALFSPPAALRIGRRVIVEFGIYQNLKNMIMRRLLEQKIIVFEGRQIDIVLHAELQATGCLVLPKSLPQVAVGGARYVEWKWEIQPQIAGLGLIRLNLDVKVDFGGRGEWGKNLLILDREVMIWKNRWSELLKINE